MKKKHSLTLIEIMLVILIIGIVGSVLSYSMRGSLEQGKVFKTKQGIAKLHELVEMRLSEVTADSMLDLNVLKKEIESTGLVKRAADLIKDGWGEVYDFKLDDENLIFESKKLNKYIERKGETKSKYYPWMDEE